MQHMRSRRLPAILAAVAFLFGGLAAPQSGLAFEVSDPATEEREGRYDEAVATVREYGADHVDSFGGLYLDRARETIVATFTRDIEDHRAKIEDRSPGLTVETIAGSNTLAELQQLHRDIRADEGFGSATGTSLFEIETDVRANVVAVGVADADATTVAAIEERYGSSRVAVYEAGPGELTECNSREDCPGPPLQGGIAGTGVQACSLAYFVVENGWYRLLTAGHCGDVGGDWYHNTLAIGQMRTDTFANGSYADAGTVGNINDTYNSNRIYVTPISWYGVDTVQAEGSDYVGQQVCLSGRTDESYRCGEILATSFSINYGSDSDPLWLYDQRTASYAWDYGDSGGAAHNAETVFGIQSGRNANYEAVYSHIGHAIAEIEARGNTISVFTTDHP